MTASAASDGFEAALAGFFADVGAVGVDVPVLQPAEPYLDTAGEDLRRRIFLTRGEEGRTLCLRPDFTIPVCIAHIAQGAGLPRRYAYQGLVFRQRRDGPAEFRQAGIENLGDADRAGADARAIAEALQALALCGASAPLQVTLGDQALFEAFLKALDLPAGWQRRLVRCFGQNDRIEDALRSLSAPEGPTQSDLDPAIMDLARKGDTSALAAHVEGLMETGGLPPKRGRSPEEVAKRLVEKIAVAETRLGEASLNRLRAFLSLDCSVSDAPTRLRQLETQFGFEFGAALWFFEARSTALVSAGVDLTAIRYRAAFGRPLDYYTGMTFEIAADGSAETLAGGGRYDRLVSYLGAREAIPAVGFSIWLDRIEAGGPA